MRLVEDRGWELILLFSGLFCYMSVFIGLLALASMCSLVLEKRHPSFAGLTEFSGMVQGGLPFVPPCERTPSRWLDHRGSELEQVLPAGPAPPVLSVCP